MPSLHLRLLGGFVITCDEQVVTSMNAARAQSLLAYLALHREVPQSRQHIAFALWPNSTEEQARTNLRKVLHQLRQAWPAIDGFVNTDGPVLQWPSSSSSTPWASDVTEFEDAVARGGFERAVALYGGDLLPDCYDDWVRPKREHLNQLFAGAAEKAISALESRREYRAAITQAQRLLQHDPLSEATYRTLMRLHTLNGDRGSMLRTYQSCEQVLKREFGFGPDPETSELYARLSNSKTFVALERERPAAQPMPLIGRLTEWAQLLEIWGKSGGSGPPQCVIIEGEAGIGKSRLAEELILWAYRQGIATATARCYAAEGALAYAPVVAWLRASVIGKTLSALDDVWLTEILRLLPELLTTERKLSPPTPLTERWQQQRLLEALARAILSGDKPLLLLLDDVQWSDQETLQLLSYLLRFDLRARLMLVGTVRSEEVGDEHPLNTFLHAMRQNGHTFEIALGPLTQDETSSLAMRLVGRALDAQHTIQLYHETEGNPLFVTETVASGEWLSIADRPNATFNSAGHTPPTVLAVINRRLSHLSPAARDVAGLAAVIGRGFTPQMLTRASERGDDQIVHCLDELLQKRITREPISQDHVNTGEYDFSHHKIREAVYRSLSTARRRLYHRRVAEALEWLRAFELDSVSGQIASHYELAGMSDLAIQHYLVAAKSARQVGAIAEATRLCRRAEVLFNGLSETASHSLFAEQLTLHECLGDLLHLSGQQREAITTFNRAFHVASAASSSHLTQVRLLCKIGNSQVLSKELDQADVTFRRALEALGNDQRYEDAEWRQQWLDVQTARATLNYWRDRPDDINEILQHVQPVVERFGTPAEQVAVYQSLLLMGLRTARYVVSDALMVCVQNLDATHGLLDNPEAFAFARFVVGFAHLWRRNLDAAEQHLHEAVKLAEHIGDITTLSRSLNYLILVYRMRGDTEQVEQRLPRSQQVAEQAGMPEYVLQALGNQAWVHWKYGRYNEAVNYGRASIAQAVKLPSGHASVVAMWITYFPLMDIALQQGDIAQATDHARNLLHPTQIRLPDLLATPVQSAIQHWDNGQVEMTRQHLQHAVEAARQLRFL